MLAARLSHSVSMMPLTNVVNTHSGPTGNTVAAIPYFIKDRRIGCVSNAVRFRKRGRQVHAAHIQRAWFRAEDLRAHDKSR